MVLFGQNGCIWTKGVVLGHNGCILARVVVFGQNGCICWSAVAHFVGDYGQPSWIIIHCNVCSVLIIILAARLIYMQTKVVVHVFRQKCLGNSGCFHENGSACIWTEWLY